MEWISVEDKLPKKGQRVWYYFEHTGVHIGWYREVLYPEEFTGETASPVFGNQFYNDTGFLTDDVTHWRPVEIPEPPKRRE